MTHAQRLAILAEFAAAAELERPSIRDDEITARQFADHKGIPIGSSRNILVALLKAGLVTRRRVFTPSKSWAYRFMENDRSSTGNSGTSGDDLEY